jgi:hypothetical protein
LLRLLLLALLQGLEFFQQLLGGFGSVITLQC